MKKLILDKITDHDGYVDFTHYYKYIKQYIKVDSSIINRTSVDGVSTLIAAIIKDRLDIVKLLLDNGANLFHKTKSGRDAYYYCNSDEMRELLKTYENRYS